MRHMFQLVAAYCGKNVIVDTRIQDGWMRDFADVPFCVALDAMALDQGAVVRTVSQELYRIERAPVQLDHVLLAELSAKIEADRPLTMRARSLLAAIALHRGRKVPEGLLPAQ